MKKRSNILLLLMICRIGLTWGQAPTLASQPKFYNYVPISIGIGFVPSQTKSDSGNVWYAKPSNALHLSSGIGAVYNKRLGIQAEAGFLFNTYNFQSPSMAYNMVQLKASINATPFVLFPLPNKAHSSLHIGCGAGYTFNNHDVLTKDLPGFKARTEGFRESALSFAPEIGLTGFSGKLSFSLLATYYYQSISYNSVVTTLQGNPGKLTLTSKGDYIGLKLRFGLRLNTKQKPPKKEPDLYLPAPPEEEKYARRANPVIRTFRTHRSEVTLEFFERERVDHDSISVSVNGKYVLVDYGLILEHKAIKVPLERGINVITVYALNEGDIPPNTATCIVKFGTRREEFPVQTGHTKNATVEIERP